MEAQKVQFGDEVKSRVTGIQGIVVSRTISLHGCDRIGIQPISADGRKVDDGLDVDEIAVELIKAGAVPADLKDMPTPEFEFGDEVVDEITGFKGTATAFTASINGCVYARVRGKYNEKENVSPSEYLHVNRFKKTAKPKAEAASRPSKSGGLETKMERPE